MKWLVLVALLPMLAHAEEVTLEVGPTFVSEGVGATVLLSQRRGNFDFSVGYVSPFECVCSWPNKEAVDSNFLAQAQFIFGSDKDVFPVMELGLGLAYFAQSNIALGSNLNASLYAGVRFNERWSLRLRHWSNANTVKPNKGFNLISLGWTF